ncbi:bile acid:sodium symporter [Streptosporangium roseum]|uniref:Na+-dependent transporter-like protein n=1 Tax=Streptosporangium roseum (strain ATCC 12428 / DSM 43021 / JCM 3005 / KCTC 9067 / NCIMB 10171 / NRRL 2505 / NI 9100) TaxID=479432 RepID=D2AR77_STRRD|nr:bile acid:sodium symporter [Streptosporangium roseum]ACZ88418.1 Na+-dependent transporter-like protein [Streptosporangium roseum DSM 43021]
MGVIDGAPSSGAGHEPDPAHRAAPPEPILQTSSGDETNHDDLLPEDATAVGSRTAGPDRNSARWPALRAVLANLPLLLLALLANLVLIPLLGWGLATLFALPAAGFVALVMVASSPGGPFGAKLSMVQKGDVVAGTAMQVLLAAVASLTFGPTSTAILTMAKVGQGISLDVAALVRTVAILQLVPFAVGLVMRHHAPSTALSWHPAAGVVSNVTFMMVLAGMLLGSRTLLAGFLLSVVAFAVGTLLATGPPTRRTTMGGIAAVRNVGPPLAAVGIAFGDEQAVLGALAAVLVSGLAAALPIAAVLGHRRQGDTA